MKTIEVGSMNAGRRTDESLAGRLLGRAGPAWIACLVLIAGTVGMARAAPIEPWSPALCQDLGRKMSEAIRLKVATSEGTTTSVTDLAPAGKACVLSAGGSGLEQTFSDAQGRMEQVLDGWKQIPEIGAGGADAMIQGYRKDRRRVVLSLEVEPPPGTCDDAPEGDCKVPMKRWTWTFKGAAYRE